MFKEDGSILKEGDKVNFKVLECNSEFKRIVMSHTSTYKSDRIEIPKKNNKKERMDKSTLGDIVALADLKKQFEDDEKNKK
jgi:small subunit ribosomal protein S1